MKLENVNREAANALQRKVNQIRQDAENAAKNTQDAAQRTAQILITQEKKRSTSREQAEPKNIFEEMPPFLEFDKVRDSSPFFERMKQLVDEQTNSSNAKNSNAKSDIVNQLLEVIERQNKIIKDQNIIISQLENK